MPEGASPLAGSHPARLLRRAARRLRPGGHVGKLEIFAFVVLPIVAAIIPTGIFLADRAGTIEERDADSRTQLAQMVTSAAADLTAGAQSLSSGILDSYEQSAVDQDQRLNDRYDEVLTDWRRASATIATIVALDYGDDATQHILASWDQFRASAARYLYLAAFTPDASETTDDRNEPRDSCLSITQSAGTGGPTELSAGPITRSCSVMYLRDLITSAGNDDCYGANFPPLSPRADLTLEEVASVRPVGPTERADRPDEFRSFGRTFGDISGFLSCSAQKLAHEILETETLARKRFEYDPLPWIDIPGVSTPWFDL